MTKPKKMKPVKPRKAYAFVWNDSGEIFDIYFRLDLARAAIAGSKWAKIKRVLVSEIK